MTTWSADMMLSVLKNGQIIVLSKEQTLVDLFHNNSLACMGDFKRAICIFFFFLLF